MKIQYIDRKFSRASSLVIQQANDIINDYRAQGYDLSLRQLYYQFVSKDLIPNRDSEYKKLGSIINDARLAGLVDWSAITDRGRNVAELLTIQRSSMQLPRPLMPAVFCRRPPQDSMVLCRNRR